jgi:hypothetical protein
MAKQPHSKRGSWAKLSPAQMTEGEELTIQYPTTNPAEKAKM